LAIRRHSRRNHSEREPQIVFVKPITDKAAQTNLLVSTTHGYQASLLLINQGEAQKGQPNVDFEMRYRPAGKFIIDPSSPSVSVAQTIALSASDRTTATIVWLNCSPVAIRGTKAEFLEWIGAGLKHGGIQIPTG
jgi:hypothetical protein